MFAGRTVFAAVVSAITGWDRERQGSDAGVRQCMAISIGGCAFSLVFLHLLGGDPTQNAAQIVEGIGFLCTGVILLTVAAPATTSVQVLWPEISTICDAAPHG